MIHNAVTHIATELNQHLKRVYDLHEDVVVVSNFLEQDGSVSPNVNNKIIISLVNIERDTVPMQKTHNANASGMRFAQTSPPLYFNLYIMIASYFSGSHYQEGLKFLSNSIGFFQSKPTITKQNSPTLDENIERLSLDIENLSMHDLSSLWGMLSGKYLPSILYKTRMVAYDSGVVTGQSDAVSSPQRSVARQ